MKESQEVTKCVKKMMSLLQHFGHGVRVHSIIRMLEKKYVAANVLAREADSAK